MGLETLKGPDDDDGDYVLKGLDAIDEFLDPHQAEQGAPPPGLQYGRNLRVTHVGNGVLHMMEPGDRDRSVMPVGPGKMALRSQGAIPPQLGRQY